MSREVKNPQERRLEFTQAAEALFIEKGYQQTSVSDIVKKMGVAHGLFYYYFNSKEELLDEIVEGMLQEAAHRLEDVVNDPDDDAIEKLRKFIYSMFDVKSSRVYLIGYVLQDKNILFYYKWLNSSKKTILPYWFSIVKQGVDEGYFDTPYPEEAVEFIFNGTRFLLSSPEALHGQAFLGKMMAAADMMERVLGAKKGVIATIYQELAKDVLEMMDASLEHNQEITNEP